MFDRPSTPLQVDYRQKAHSLLQKNTELQIHLKKVKKDADDLQQLNNQLDQQNELLKSDLNTLAEEVQVLLNTLDLKSLKDMRDFSNNEGNHGSIVNQSYSNNNHTGNSPYRNSNNSPYRNNNNSPYRDSNSHNNQYNNNSSPNRNNSRNIFNLNRIVNRIKQTEDRKKESLIRSAKTDVQSPNDYNLLLKNYTHQYRTMLQEYKQIIQALQEKCHKEELKCTSIQDKLKDMETSQYQQLFRQKQFANLQREIKIRQTRISALEQQLRSSVKDADQWKNSYEEWNNSCEKWKNIAESNRQEIEKLRTQVAEWRNSAERVDEMACRLTNQVEQAKKEAKLLTNTGLLMQQQIQKLKIEVERAQIDLKKSDEKMTKLKETNNQLADRLKWLETKYAKQIANFQQMQEHVGEKLIEVEKEMNYYKKERQQHLTKIRSLQGQIINLQSHIASLESIDDQVPYFKVAQVLKGDPKTVDIRVEPEGTGLLECLEQSVKNLLNENQSLKKTLQAVRSGKESDSDKRELALLHMLNGKPTSTTIDGKSSRKSFLSTGESSTMNSSKATPFSA